MIMQIARDVSALAGDGQAAFGFGAAAMFGNATAVIEIRADQRYDHDGGLEPGRLPQEGRQCEGKRSASFIPDAIFVRREDLEPVVTGTKVRVLGHAACARIDPVLIEAMQ